MSLNTLVAQFGDALGEFDSTVSLAGSPTDWLQANTKQIRAAVDDFLYSKLGNHVYPRFYEYTLAHLESCNPRLLDSLIVDHFKWTRIVGEVAHLLHYRTIRERLWSYLKHCEERHSGDTSAGIRIRKLLRLDTLCIVARILAVLYNHEQRRLLISQRDAQAQSLLDLFQELLDCDDLGPDIRPPLVRAVVELSKASGLYPRSLVLQGVDVKGRGPVNGGSFGDIWEGEFDGRMIAIKVMRIDKDLKVFCKEAVLWRQLSSRHVLPLYGVYHLPQRPLQVCLVSPWMANGNIVQYLKDTPQANRHSLMVDVAHGLKYLHSFDPPIVHGDLKGANILIDSSPRARLADFGLGTLVQDSIVRFTPTAGSYLAGTPHYMAPEILSPKEGELTSATRASDIYSFACVCYEVFVGRPRFSGYNTPQVITAVVIEDRRPSRAPGIDDATWRLMNRCWDKNPASRPSANDLLLELSPQTGVPGQEGDQEDPVRRLQSSLTYDLSRALEFAAGEVTERQHPLTEPSPAPRASSDVDSLWTSDMRRTRGTSAPAGMYDYMLGTPNAGVGSSTSLGFPQAIATKNESGQFVDLIYPVTGKPRGWANWKSIPIEIGDYGVVNRKTGEFEVDGNIYGPEVKDSLKSMNPAMDLDQYLPKLGEPEKDFVISSEGVTSCDFDPGVEIPGIASADLKGRWKFVKGKRGVLLVMRRPRRTSIPSGILGTLTTLPELNGKHIVSTVFSCPAYFIYSSDRSGETVSFALVPQEPTVSTAESTDNETVASEWRIDPSPPGRIHKGYDNTGRYSFTPLCALRRKALPFRQFFRYEG